MLIFRFILVFCVSTRTCLHAVMLKKTLFSSYCLPEYTCIYPLSETLRFSAFQRNCNGIAMELCCYATVWVHVYFLSADVIYIHCNRK